MPALARLLIAAGALAVLAGGAAPARAQEEGAPLPEPGPGEPAPKPIPRDRFSLKAPYGTGDLEGGELVMCFVEGVSLSRSTFTLEARSVVVWADHGRILTEGGDLAGYAGSARAGGAGPKEPPEPPPGKWSTGGRDIPDNLKSVLGPVLHSFYAEGDVRFTLGTRTVRAESLFVDFNRNILATGRVMLSMAIAVTNRPRPLPLIVRAGRMRRVSEDTLLLESARYSTCDFDDPHFSFRCTSFEVTDHDDHSTFAAWNNVLDVEGVPLLYLPFLWGRSDLGARPLRSATYRSSNRFGQEVLILWADDVFLKGGRWGEWRVHTDWRSRRGIGIGPEAEYEYAGYEGKLLAWWQRDRAGTDVFDGSPVPREERGRVRWEHRQRIDDALRLDFSLWDFSDRNFQREYLKEEFFQEKDPETYGVLRYREGSDVATLSAKVRVDRFRTETTETPEIGFHRIAAAAPAAFVPGWLLDGLLYTADGRAGGYEREFDEATGLKGDGFTREDAVARLEGVKWLGPVSLAPFGTAGATAAQGIEAPGRDRNQGRGDIAAGLRVGLEARRDFEGVESGLFDLRGLRHLAALEGLYYDRCAVTEDPAGTRAVDRIDTLEEVRVGGVRLRNRLQTQREGRRVDWVDLELRGLWFPGGLDGRASPLRSKEEGLEEERFRDFLGEEKYRALPPPGEWGPWEGDLRVRLRESLYLLGEGEYEPHDHRFRTSAAGVRWFVVPKFSLWLGNRRIARDSDIYTFTADWFFSERWGIHLENQTNRRGQERLRTEIGLRRVWHDFELEITFKNDQVTRDRSVSFSLVPIALWVPPTSAERLGKLDFEAQRWYR